MNGDGPIGVRVKGVGPGRGRCRGWLALLSLRLVLPGSVLSKVNKWQEEGVFSDPGRSGLRSPTDYLKFSSQVQFGTRNGAETRAETEGCHTVWAGFTGVEATLSASPLAAGTSFSARF